MFPDYTSLPQYANILHLYKLDEESGTREDSKGSCDLADNNTVLYGSGKIGNGADFELDTNEYLSVNAEASADMNFTTGNFSISFWWRPETDITSQGLISRGVWEVSGWEILFGTTNKNLLLRMFTLGGNTSVISDSDLFSAGTLYHITVVRNGASGYIYVNAVDKTSDTTISNAVSSSDEFRIGERGDGSLNTDGLLDEVIVWNVALSPAEVSTLYSWYSKVGLSGAISFSGNLDRKPQKTLIGSISFTGSLTRLPKILLTGSISFVGTLQRLPKKLLTGAITFTGTLSKKVKKILTGTISFIGNLFSPYLDGIWSLFIKRTTTWTGQDKETTDWSAIEKEDTDWTAQD